MKSYLAVLEPARDGTWSAYVPDLPGCTSFGVTQEDVARNVREAVSGHIEVCATLGKPYPSRRCCRRSFPSLSAER